MIERVKGRSNVCPHHVKPRPPALETLLVRLEARVHRMNTRHSRAEDAGGLLCCLVAQDIQGALELRVDGSPKAHRPARQIDNGAHACFFGHEAHGGVGYRSIHGSLHARKQVHT